jgi:hypothetical protein
MLPGMHPNPPEFNNGFEPFRVGENRGPISPELVRNIADRVYARLLRELRIERERQRFPGRRTGHARGEP